MMRSVCEYYSTNHRAKSVSFKEALIQGQAPDKGLYMPSAIPKISSEAISEMKEMPYSDIAFEVANELLKGEIPESDLKKITKQAHVVLQVIIMVVLIKVLLISMI